jgi:hypothetical protein
MSPPCEKLKQQTLSGISHKYRDIFLALLHVLIQEAQWCTVKITSAQSQYSIMLHECTPNITLL